MKTDVLIVGSGCSALYMALHLSEDLNILMVTKKEDSGKRSGHKVINF